MVAGPSDGSEGQESDPALSDKFVPSRSCACSDVVVCLCLSVLLGRLGDRVACCCCPKVPCIQLMHCANGLADEVEELDLQDLVRKGQVAWLEDATRMTSGAGGRQNAEVAFSQEAGAGNRIT
jgi:hypothetical protein